MNIRDLYQGVKRNMFYGYATAFAIGSAMVSSYPIYTEVEIPKDLVHLSRVYEIDKELDKSVPLKSLEALIMDQVGKLRAEKNGLESAPEFQEEKQKYQQIKDDIHKRRRNIVLGGAALAFGGLLGKFYKVGISIGSIKPKKGQLILDFR